MTHSGPCPCGSGNHYTECCEPLHLGQLPAEQAVQLMRSRYAAFTLGLSDYLVKTWHPLTRPAHLDIDPAQRWMGLRILRTERGRTEDDRGEVEFIARFKVNGKAHRLHENSRFVRASGDWLYMDGDILTP